MAGEHASTTRPVYEVRTELDREYKDFLNDLVKLTTVYFVAVYLHCTLNAKPAKLIEALGVEIYALLVLGLVAYHLVVKLLVKFV